MIDPTDRQTSPLPLDEQPATPRRGRPVTGKALSNAERQRRYRENLKAQRNENMHKAVAEDMRAELAKAMERIEELESELKRWKKLATAAERARQTLAEELTSRDENNQQGGPETKAENLPGVWIVERKSRKGRTWKPCGNPETNLKDARNAVDYMQFKSGSGQAEEWRALRADGMIYWPLWTKAKAPK